MRRTALLIALLLVVGGCGGGDDSPAAESTTTSPSTTTTTTTTTMAMTTTTEPSTTTTVPPWATLPDPGMQLWGAVAGDPIEIGSMCIELTTAGSAPPDVESWVEGISDNLRVLGVSVVPEGCETVLSLSLTGRRSSADYSSAGVCWSGAKLSGEAALAIDGEVRHSWRINQTYPPPERISWCPTEDDPIYWYTGANDTWHDLFAELLGDKLTNLLTYINLDTRRYWDCWQGPLTEAEARTVASFLARSRANLTVGWLHQCPPEETEQGTLLPLVPYLIALLEESDSRPNSWPFPPEAVLGRITGTAFSSQEDWWDWWEEQRG